MRGLRRAAGALMLDVPRTLLALRPCARPPDRAPWIFLRNRSERLEAGPDGRGARCDWRWTADVYVPSVFPAFGRMLLRRALRDWPIGFADAPLEPGPPEVSFLIGHRGLERLPLLLAVLRTIAAQQGARVECVVVEQSAGAAVGAALPAWVRHVHTPPPDPDMPYSRAWAFNVAAREAHGPLLVLHDGDLLVPRAYAAEVRARAAEGHEVIDLKRFLFELSAAQNAVALAGRPAEVVGALERVRQNAQGGTLALRRATFLQLGGFDESFVGWGGEDNEFWERAATRRTWAFGYLPFVHLWHAPQPGKDRAPNVVRYRTLAAVAPDERAASLRVRAFGSRGGPVPPYCGPPWPPP